MAEYDTQDLRTGGPLAWADILGRNYKAVKRSEMVLNMEYHRPVIHSVQSRFCFLIVGI